MSEIEQEKNKDNLIDQNSDIIVFKSKEEQEREAARAKRKEKRKKFSLKRILAGFLILIVAVAAFIVLFFPIKNIEVKGNQYYTDREIINSMKSDGYIPNVVILKIRNAVSPIETMPFVEKIDIKMKDHNTVTIQVHEWIRAGCIKYSGNYVYFNKKGTALEVTKTRRKEVPLVTGLTFDKINLGEKLPVKEKGRFDDIVKITTLVTKNNLTVKKIQFRTDGTVRLKIKKLTVYLGEPEELDAKLSVLPNVLQSLKKERGNLYLENYSEDTKVITFKKKK